MMPRLTVWLLAPALCCAPAQAGTRIAGDWPASVGVILVSSNPRFDESCTTYIGQGNSAEVPAARAEAYCACMADEFEERSLKRDALDFLARTYSEDLTTFIHEYPRGDAWMQESFKAEAVCQSGDKAEAAPAADDDDSFPRDAGSWGGVVRSGPGREYKRLTSLPEGARVTLLQDAGARENGFPWMKITYDGSKTGYQWGGILCSIDTPIPEVFETCTK
ncbi:hypothetical protein Sa4125_31060 [Aureimonas sp. SA4125]|uniref:SH3 domain-containing protein n=1 Tax=Aureimonas sp. SA4125 TaxID=2826993 RepID=UPI001CC535DA|nr:SH3 domain-containing protein [Aureimonas sp. SA4125]BDA85564.1 hypothetical protein Sa4125_31060 [Aureimonas sp. SA4125]